jgi:ornithine lipid ester-linked acyl 2-hydroxylase
MRGTVAAPDLTICNARRAPDPPGALGLLSRLLPIVERLVARGSKIGNRPFFEPESFPWIEQVEERATAIRREVDRLLDNGVPIPGFEELSEQQRVLSDDRRWRTYFLLAYGLEVEANTAACPESWKAVRMIPGVTSACFSILDPGKSLPLHRGPYKGVLRYHLGVRIPEGGARCGLIVAGETRRWVEGRSIVFDDTYRHAAFNHSDEPRVVLFVDFMRPLRFPASLLNRMILWIVRHSRYLRAAKVRLAAWEAAQADLARRVRPSG